MYVSKKGGSVIAIRVTRADADAGILEVEHGSVLGDGSFFGSGSDIRQIDADAIESNYWLQEDWESRFKHVEELEARIEGMEYLDGREKRLFIQTIQENLEDVDKIGETVQKAEDLNAKRTAAAEEKRRVEREEMEQRSRSIRPWQELKTNVKSTVAYAGNMASMDSPFVTDGRAMIDTRRVTKKGRKSADERAALLRPRTKELNRFGEEGIPVQNLQRMWDSFFPTGVKGDTLEVVGWRDEQGLLRRVYLAEPGSDEYLIADADRMKFIEHYTDYDTIRHIPGKRPDDITRPLLFYRDGEPVAALQRIVPESGRDAGVKDEIDLDLARKVLAGKAERYTPPVDPIEEYWKQYDQTVNQAFKGKTGKTVTLGDGEERKASVIDGGLAILKEEEKSQFQIYHVATGLRVGHDFNTLRDTKRAMWELLQTDIDWTKPEYSNEEIAQMKTVTEEIYERVWNRVVPDEIAEAAGGIEK